MLSLVAGATSISVPTVLCYCDHHDEYPAPFSLTSYVDGENGE
jgi:aminoglycoside phosphotransferase (APT) family kinase protein